MVGHFDYYGGYCVCRRRVLIQMRDLDGNEPDQWPVNVYDVNENYIGTAESKEEYIELWNSSEINQEVGRLIGGYGPFGFELILRAGQSEPDYVIGDTGDVVVDEGIYDSAYGIEYQ